ncbi:hypothetical protein NRY95_06630 [Xanthomonas campestris pv. phormiicola]|nr:hypothetical protein [Xanthomonas campestris pv. phormiicola]UYC17627.1 hypothetical protein NRY95_06630 [Xanthomonas campestris pv. phormiicola]
MRSRVFLQKLSFACIFGLSVVAGAASAQQDNWVITSSTTTYYAGSPELSALKAWMKQHYSRDSKLPLGGVDQLGTVTVTKTILQLDRATANAIGSNPPITSLPSGGQPGDSVTINSCINHQKESWTYVWVSDGNGGGSWALQAYHGENVKSCPTPGT